MIRGGGDACSEGAAARIDPSAPSGTFTARWAGSSGREDATTRSPRRLVVVQPPVRELPRTARLTVELSAAGS